MPVPTLVTNKIKIAIVDDHLLFCKSLRVLINLFPRYHVIFDAANGKDFIRQLKKDNLPAIVLMDIHMPGMDGFETVKTLRRLKDIKYQALPVIALTGSVFAEHERMIKDAGMNDFVLKPFDSDLLYRKIKRLLGQNKGALDPLT